MLDRTVLAWIRQLAGYAPFRQTWNFSDKQLEEQYDLELVVRFLVLRNVDITKLNGGMDLDYLLTNSLVNRISTGAIDQDREAAAFKWAFDVLARQLGADSFRVWNPEKAVFEGRSLITSFDALAVGLGHHFESYATKGGEPQVAPLSQTELITPEFLNKTKSGTRAVSRVIASLPVGRDGLKP